MHAHAAHGNDEEGTGSRGRSRTPPGGSDRETVPGVFPRSPVPDDFEERWEKREQAMDMRFNRMLAMSEMQMTSMNNLMSVFAADLNPTATTSGGGVQPAAAPTVAPTPSIQPAAPTGLLAGGVAQLEPEKELPDKVRRFFAEAGRDFERTMVKCLNTNKFKHTLKEKCETFKNNDPSKGWKYPKGVRAWHAPV